MLFSAYSLPNLFIPLIGGYLMDRLGVHTLMYFSGGLIAFGQSIFALGVSLKSFNLALLGRVIFGCGGDNLEIAQSIVLIN